MNYFPFHIGDYLSATRHLSWDEDAAYRRLLDTYYTTEKPLPADLRAVCRLVVASTEAQRDAVKVVLEEFFVPTPDGWVNSRADEEIKAMREKSEQTGERVEHEKTRKERYRERRAFLFAFLRSRDVVPEYDIGMKPLTDLASSHGWDGSYGTAGDGKSVPAPSVDTVPGGVPVERDRNVPVDAPGTAIPTPTPTPTPKKKPPLPPKGGAKRFDEFWLAWPKHERKQDRKTCCERWDKEGLDEIADEILADVRAKRGTQKWRDGFVEAPLVYLNRRRWEDGNTEAEAQQEAIV